MMKILTFLILLITSFASAQWHNAIVEMKSGERIETKTFVVDEEQKRFKLKPANSETHNVLLANSENVASISYQMEGRELILKKLPVDKKGKNKPIDIFAETIFEGEKISIIVGYKPYFENNRVTGKITSTNYYIFLNGKEFSVPIGKINSNNKGRFLDSNQLRNYLKDTSFNLSVLKDDFDANSLVKLATEFENN